MTIINTEPPVKMTEEEKKIELLEIKQLLEEILL